MDSSSFQNPSSTIEILIVHWGLHLEEWKYNAPSLSQKFNFVSTFPKYENQIKKFWLCNKRPTFVQVPYSNDFIQKTLLALQKWLGGINSCTSSWSSLVSEFQGLLCHGDWQSISLRSYYKSRLLNETVNSIPI